MVADQACRVVFGQLRSACEEACKEALGEEHRAFDLRLFYNGTLCAMRLPLSLRVPGGGVGWGGVGWGGVGRGRVSLNLNLNLNKTLALTIALMITLTLTPSPFPSP